MYASEDKQPDGETDGGAQEAQQQADTPDAEATDADADVPVEEKPSVEDSAPVGQDGPEQAEVQEAADAGDKQPDEAAEAEQAEKSEPGSEPREATSEHQAGPQQQASPGQDQPGAEMDVDVYGVLRLFVSMVTEQAWIHLGLQAAPGKSETETRLPEARVAIDTLQFLRKQLEHNLDDSEKRELDRVISTLQINYIQRT